MSPRQAEDALRALLHLVDAHAGHIRQILVVNTKQSYSLPDDYPEFSVTTEYLSDAELDQMLKGFRDSGVVTDLYVGESEFIRALTNGSELVNQSRDLLVYSTVPSGTWHGRDSLIPALCGAWSVGYCGSDAYGMAVAGNKYYALRLAERCGESTGGIFLYSPRQGWCNGHRPPSGVKVIIKPALECASIGIDDASVCWVDATLEEVVAGRAERLRQPMLVQPFISGYEIEVPVYGVPEPLAPAAFGISAKGSADLGDHYLTYEQVFGGEYSYYPLAELDPVLDLDLRRSACRVFRELGLYGYARIDYRVRHDGTWGITDINAIPHLTPDASNSLSFATLGLSYPEVLKLVTAAGLTRIIGR